MRSKEPRRVVTLEHQRSARSFDDIAREQPEPGLRDESATRDRVYLASGCCCRK